jgi:inner membrane protein
VHPVQYGLIGLSLSMFYILLLSLTEHIGFNKAYIVSAHTTIALISMYSYYTLKSFKRIGILIGVLTMIYGYLFILMQLETYALLAGAIGLFVILGAVMYLSRTLNWYELEQ